MKNNSPLALLFISLFLLSSFAGHATNFTSAASGNWGTAATWSPSGVPTSKDNVTIAHGMTITVNTAAACTNLTIGDATSGVTTVNVSSGITLSIAGACSINPSNLSNTYTLNAGAGTINIAGTFAWSTTGTNLVEASTGTLTFTPAITIAASTQSVKLTGAGTINFNSSFTDNYNKLVPYTGSTINFAGGYTVSTTAASWAGVGTANFSGTSTITANSSLTLFNLQTAASSSISLASASGTVVVGGAVTIGSGSTFTAHENFEVDGNWTNNGTFSGGSTTITFNKSTTLTGTTTFPYVQIGNTAASNTVGLTLNNNITCLGLTLNGYNQTRTLTLSTGDTLKVNGNALIQQPTAAKTNTLAINGGTCIINGNLSFTGTVTTASYTSKVAVTTGSLLVTGSVSYAANTVAANQIITLTSTGNITFSSPVSMAYGTLSNTGSGTFNFNGSSPSFTFGGSSVPVFATTNGSIINFVNGFTNNSNALTFAAASNTYFTGNGTLTANADITFGNVQFSNSDTLASTSNIVDVAGNCVMAQGAVFNALQDFDATGSYISLDSGSTYIQYSGTLTVSGNIIDSGTITASPGGIFNFDGTGAVISGTGAITDSAGTITISDDKTIASGSSLTIGTPTANTTVNIASGATVSNAGSIILYGSITGVDGTSMWLNNAYSSLTVTGDILDIGALDASTPPNTVSYVGNGNQNIAPPVGSYYDLIVTNSGIKQMTADVQVDDAVIIANEAILNEDTFSLNGLGSLNMNDTSGLVLQRSASGEYPELLGVYTLTGGTVTINQTSNSAVVTPAKYYNLVLNGASPYDMSGVDTVQVNFYMFGSATLSNSENICIGDTFTYASSAYSTLYGNVIVPEISILNGTLDDGGDTITIIGEGGWNMSGGNFNSTGQTVFYSDSGIAQVISGSSPATFHHLLINNPDGVTLSLSPAAATSVSAYLNLTLGNVFTDSLNILLCLDTATSINSSINSYVWGPMQKVGATNFMFPVGKSGIYEPAGISSIIDTATLVTCEYFPASYTTLLPLANNLSQVSNREFWMIERTVTSDSLQVQLYWTDADFSDIENCDNLTIAHYTNYQWNNENAAPVSGSACSGSGSGSVQTIGYVSTFSPFTFGSKGSGHSLPITLVAFNAVPRNTVVVTNWQTALEINNDYFTVERSGDGENFVAIGTVKGAGNSTVEINYLWTDENPLNGVSYYRLKQTDFNGNSSYSEVVPVSMSTPASITIYPNPASTEAFMNFTNLTGPVSFTIYDVTGKRIYGGQFDNAAGTSNQTISIPVKQLFSPGMYFVNGISNGTEFNEKLIINN